MKYNPIFEWDEETNTAGCILSDGEHYFTGLAVCHPDDIDLCSQKTGYEIALRRARIEYLKFYRDTLKIQLGSLKQFYYSISHSKKFNSKSYEVKMLYKHIDRLEFDLNYARELISTERQELYNFINTKEKLYQKIRKLRINETKVSDVKDNLEKRAQSYINLKEFNDKHENI